MKTVVFQSRTFGIRRFAPDAILVGVTSATGILKSKCVSTEIEAYQWLGDNGLKRAKIKMLLDDFDGSDT